MNEIEAMRVLNMKNMKPPSLKNDNPLTWKCKLFGCKNETLPCIWYESGEKHGIKGSRFATVTTTTTTFTFSGCIWCTNFRKIKGQETEDWPKWLCDCDTCEGEFNLDL